MRENRFSENSCPGRKTNSQRLLPMAVWPTLRQGRPGSVPPGSGSPCREWPAGTPPPRTPCFLLLHFLSPPRSFPAGLWGHCVHEFEMRLTAALTKDPLLGECRRLWGRIRLSPLGLSQIPLATRIDGREWLAFQRSPDSDFLEGRCSPTVLNSLGIVSSTLGCLLGVVN